MKYKTILLLLIITLCIAGCVNNRVWRNNEFVDWYSKYWYDNNKNQNAKALHYQGTSSEHHHFIMHTVDSWLLIRIEKSEINISNEKPYISGSSAPFPGYYIVDPVNGFKRVEK